jgi:hypothetical protein
LNLTRHGHPVQPLKINTIQEVDMSRDVAVMVHDQLAKYVQNVHRGVVTKLFVMNIHKLANCAASL